jgi:hypothetical protein
MEKSSTDNSNYLWLDLEIPGDLTMGQAVAIKNKVKGNAVFVEKRRSLVCGYIEDFKLEHYKLKLKTKITDLALWENIDNYDYIVKHYHQVDCLYYLMEREQ